MHTKFGIKPTRKLVEEVIAYSKMTHREFERVFDMPQGTLSRFFNPPYHIPPKHWKIFFKVPAMIDERNKKDQASQELALSQLGVEPKKESEHVDVVSKSEVKKIGVLEHLLRFLPYCILSHLFL